MTQGSVGWLCPKCGGAHAPWQTTCSSLGTVRGYSGTITIGSTISSSMGMGTVFLGGYNTFDTPRTPTFKEKRADEVITTWKKDGGWGKLRTLIIDAMSDAVEEECSDEDDDE